MVALASRALRMAVGSISFAVLMYLAASVRYRRLLIEAGEGRLYCRAQTAPRTESCLHLGASSPISIFTVVLLPAPFGPT
jgi:hypothetical protein